MSAGANQLVSRRWLIVLVVFVGLAAWRLLQDPETETPTGPSSAVAFGGAVMGTTYTVKLSTHGGFLPDTERAAQVVREALDLVDERMSTYRPGSEVSRFNRARGVEPFAVSAETAEVVAVAREVSVASDGAFDVTVGPLVRAWGFGAGAEPEPPSAEALAALRERIGYEKLAVDTGASTLTKTHPEIDVDLSAIAKGYAVDRAAEALRALGSRGFMVEVGGEVRTAGHNERGEPWQIGIERPDPNGRSVHLVVALAGRALATSGDYRNFREVEGRRISHTIDPRSGRPIAHRLASVTVVHERCVVADAWATALNVLGPEQGPVVAEERGIAALFLVRGESGDFREVASPALEALSIYERRQP